MPKAINNGNVTNSLLKAFQFKGRYIPMLDEVIVPVYQIADPVPAAPGLVFGGSIFADGVVATEAPVFRLRNPPNSGVLLSVSAVSTGYAEIAIGPTKANLVVAEIQFSPGILGDASGVPIARDTRNLVQSRASLTSLNTVPTSAAATSLVKFTVKTSGERLELEGGAVVGVRQPLVVLQPNTALDIRYTVGDGLFAVVNYSWLEVPIIDGTPQ